MIRRLGGPMWVCVCLKAAPAGSISSMEVNIDMLEQMDLMDVSDQEALDVFLNSVEEEGVPSPPSSGIYCQGTSVAPISCVWGQFNHYVD